MKVEKKRRKKTTGLLVNLLISPEETSKLEIQKEVQQKWITSRSERLPTKKAKSNQVANLNQIIKLLKVFLDGKLQILFTTFFSGETKPMLEILQTSKPGKRFFQTNEFNKDETYNSHKKFYVVGSEYSKMKKKPKSQVGRNTRHPNA